MPVSASKPIIITLYEAFTDYNTNTFFLGLVHQMYGEPSSRTVADGHVNLKTIQIKHIQVMGLQLREAWTTHCGIRFQCHSDSYINGA